MRAFWYALCQGDKTVKTSTITLCDTWNAYSGENWNLGDEWRIYGNQYAVLPN